MKNKKSILISLIVVSLVIFGIFWYKSSNQTKNSDANNTESTQNENVNYSPPTKEEEEQANQIKSKDSNQAESGQQHQTNTTAKKKVTPIITSSGQTPSTVEVSARVPGVNEDGGTCTLTLTKSGHSVSGTRKGVSNVSEVSCGFISIPKNKVNSGTWIAKVSYSSKLAEGTSAEIPLKVQW